MDRELLELQLNGYFDVEGFINKIYEKEPAMKTDYGRKIIIKIMNECARDWNWHKGMFASKLSYMFGLEMNEIRQYFTKELI